MANETDEKVDVEEVEETEPEATESTDWEARAKRLEEKAIVQRERTREMKARLAKLESSQQTKPSGLDYSEKAFLAVKGYTAPDEIALVQRMRERTGDTLEAIIEDDVFQGKIANMRDEKLAQQAVPQATKRSLSSSRTDPAYWVAKGELPKGDDPATRQLRRDVVNLRLKQETSGSAFTDSPVVS